MPLLIDSYEDQDLAEYTGGTSDFEIVAGGGTDSNGFTVPSAIDGSYVLVGIGGSPFTGMSAYPGATATDLDNYFEIGNTLRVWAQWTNGNLDQRIVWGVNGGDGYHFEYNPGQGFIDIRKRVNGSQTTLLNDDNAAELNTNTWYYWEIEWDDGSLGGSNGDITVRIYDSSDTLLYTTSTVNDTELTSNTGIGFYHSTSTSNSFYWDYLNLPNVGGAQTATADIGTLTVAGQDVATAAETTATQNFVSLSLTALDVTKDIPAIDLVIDDYEDGNLNEYTNTTNFEVAAGGSTDSNGNTVPSAINGSNVLVGLGGTAFQATSAYPGATATDLDNYFERGNVLRVWAQWTNGNLDQRVMFGVAGGDNSFHVGHNPAQSTLDIRKRVNGTQTTLLDDNAVPALSDNTWYYYEIEWDDGTLGGLAGDITVRIYEADDTLVHTTTTVNDTDHASNTGIGYYHSTTTSNSWYWDYAIVPDAGTISARSELGTLTVSAQDVTADVVQPTVTADLGTLSLSVVDPYAEHYLTGPDLVIDDYEDGDFSEYEGSLTAFEIAAGGSTDSNGNTVPTAINGSNVLVGLGGTTFSGIGAYPGLTGTDLDSYFEIGAKMRVWHRFTSGTADRRIVFANNATDEYHIEHNPSVGNLDIRKNVNDVQSSLLSDTNVPALSNDTWYYYEIEWDDGTLGGSNGDITVRIYEADGTRVYTSATVNDTDNTTNTGIGFYHSTTSTTQSFYWDYVIVPGADDLIKTATADVGTLSVTGQDAIGAAGTVTTTQVLGTFTIETPAVQATPGGIVAFQDLGAATFGANGVTVQSQVSVTSQTGEITLSAIDSQGIAGVVTSTTQVAALTLTSFDNTAQIGATQTTVELVSLSLTGQDTDTLAVASAIQEAGLLSIIGQDTDTLAVASATTVEAVLSIIGLDAASQAGTVGILPETGLLTFTAESPTVPAGLATPIATVGELVLDGQTALVQTGSFSPVVDIGELTLSAIDNSAIAGESISVAEAALLTLVQNDPTIATIVSALSQVGTLTISGEDVLADIGFFVSVDAGTLSLTVFDTDAILPYFIDVVSASLTLNTNNTVVNAGTVEATQNVGLLSLALIAPEALAGGFFTTSEVGAMSLQGIAPEAIPGDIEALQNVAPLTLLVEDNQVLIEEIITEQELGTLSLTALNSAIQIGLIEAVQTPAELSVTSQAPVLAPGATTLTTNVAETTLQVPNIVALLTGTTVIRISLDGSFVIYHSILGSYKLTHGLSGVRSVNREVDGTYSRGNGLNGTFVVNHNTEGTIYNDQN